MFQRYAPLNDLSTRAESVRVRQYFSGSKGSPPLSSLARAVFKPNPIP